MIASPSPSVAVAVAGQAAPPVDRVAPVPRGAVLALHAPRVVVAGLAANAAGRKGRAAPGVPVAVAERAARVEPRIWGRKNASLRVEPRVRGDTIVQRISGHLQYAACKFSTKIFLIRFFLHCVHNSVVLVPDFFLFAIKLKIIIFNLFIRFIKKTDRFDWIAL